MLCMNYGLRFGALELDLGLTILFSSFVNSFSLTSPNITSTAKQVLSNCERMILAKFIENTADTANKILFSDWSVNLKLCSDWLGELSTDEFQLL